jgi:MYXO-CTERM domain-containing protein
MLKLYLSRRPARAGEKEELVNIKCVLGVAGLAMGCAVASVASGQVILSATMTVDNQFVAYISTSPTTLGTPFLSGNSWPTVVNGTYTFNSGGTYYLHIAAVDLGAPQMFIGDFQLSNATAVFGNGAQRIQTGSSFWRASFTGVGQNLDTTIDLGALGTSPWSSVSDPALVGARFIWSQNTQSGAAPAQVWFSIPISVAPAPGAAGLAGLGLLAASRRRR